MNKNKRFVFFCYANAHNLITSKTGKLSKSPALISIRPWSGVFSTAFFIRPSVMSKKISGGIKILAPFEKKVFKQISLWAKRGVIRARAFFTKSSGLITSEGFSFGPNNSSVLFLIISIALLLPPVSLFPEEPQAHPGTHPEEPK